MAFQRSSESQMDFEYQNGHGMVDPTSPFAKYARDRTLQDNTDSLAKKRTYSVFNSPVKGSAFPEPRDPASSHTMFFSQPSPSRPASALPPRMLNNPAFNTPRKPQPEVDTTPESSPDNNADTEATPDTADMGLRTRLVGASKALTKFVGAGDSPSSSPATRKRSGSPGKGEIARGKYSHAIERRVYKRRARDVASALWRPRSSASESSDASSSTKKQQKKKGKGGDDNNRGGSSGHGPIAAFFSFIEHHPGLPHILSYYTQTLLNIFFVGVIIYAAWAFWATVQADVREKAAEKAADIMAEMAVCTESFNRNNCGAKDRAPALESICDNWKKCMSKDPMAVGWAKVSAHTFAEIYNSFIEPISLKAAIFTIVIYLGTVAAANMAFSLTRRSQQQAGMPPTPGFQQWMPPPTPRQGGGHADEIYWQHSNYATPHRSPQKLGGYDDMRSLGMDSPRRQLQYQ